MDTPQLVSSSDLEKLRHLFESHDIDGNGELDRSEIKKMLKCNYKLAGFATMPFDHEADAFFDQLDTDRSGAVDFDEFARAICRSRKDRLMGMFHEYFQSIGLKIWDLWTFWRDRILRISVFRENWSIGDWGSIIAEILIKLFLNCLFARNTECLFEFNKWISIFILDLDTSSLDGETALKQKQALPKLKSILIDDSFYHNKRCTIECEQPNENPSAFEGKLIFTTN